jgi:methylated-DNA-[protein]-cysteine S-methyltransferase
MGPSDSLPETDAPTRAPGEPDAALGEGDHSGRYLLFDTAFGLCGISWRRGAVTRLQLPESHASATENRLRQHGLRAVNVAPDTWIARAIAVITDYFAGREVDLRSIPVDLSPATDFDRRVYVALRDVTWGHTTTYGALARAVGEPDAPRAVGRALSRNPLPILVPCHRVVATGGDVGGFSAPGGRITKARLLALEHIALDDENPTRDLFADQPM